MSSDLFYVLSKVLHFLILPLSWVIIIIISSFFFKNHWRKKILIFGLILLTFFSNPFIIQQVLKWWEVPPTPISQMTQTYEVGIVLGGVTLSKKPTDRTYLSRGADRVMHAVLLYQKGIIKKILVTGGGADSVYKSEAEQMADLLKICQIPQKDILLEKQAKNTYQNALLSKEILQKQDIKGKLLLITSAYHLPRTIACFKKQGLQFDGFATDFLTPDYHKGIDWVNVLLPNSQALEYWQILIHEWMGFLIYSLVGYV